MLEIYTTKFDNLLVDVYKDYLILYKYILYDREEFTDFLERFCKFLEK